MKEYINYMDYMGEYNMKVLKEFMYFSGYICFYSFIDSLIIGLINFFFPTFNLGYSSWYFGILAILFFLMIVDKLRIGFIENLFTDGKKYKNFKLWFKGMEKHSYSEKEVKEFIKNEKAR